jgi:hypothetical protein
MKSLKGTKTLENLMKAFAENRRHVTGIPTMPRLLPKKDTSRLRRFSMRLPIMRKNMQRDFLSLLWRAWKEKIPAGSG